MSGDEDGGEETAEGSELKGAETGSSASASVSMPKDWSSGSDIVFCASQITALRSSVRQIARLRIVLKDKIKLKFICLKINTRFRIHVLFQNQPKRAMLFLYIFMSVTSRRYKFYPSFVVKKQKKWLSSYILQLSALMPDTG